MKSNRTKRLLAATALTLTSMLAGTAWAATTSFTATYSGASTAGGSCGSTYNISGAEPSTTGTYPVFIYMVGTNETYNNAAAMAAVNSMAAKGYVAATVDYATSQFGNCSVLTSKSSCAFNANSSASAVAALCSRSKADCSKGIVVSGFSQGSILTLLAKNYDVRVQAAYGIGMSMCIRLMTCHLAFPTATARWQATGCVQSMANETTLPAARNQPCSRPCKT